jgi:hypothetical protein
MSLKYALLSPQNFFFSTLPMIQRNTADDSIDYCSARDTYRNIFVKTIPFACSSYSPWLAPLNNIHICCSLMVKCSISFNKTFYCNRSCRAHILSDSFVFGMYYGVLCVWTMKIWFKQIWRRWGLDMSKNTITKKTSGSKRDKVTEVGEISHRTSSVNSREKRINWLWLTDSLTDWLSAKLLLTLASALLLGFESHKSKSRYDCRSVGWSFLVSPTIWGPRSDFCYCQLVAVFVRLLHFCWFCQHSHSWLQSLRDPWPRFLFSPRHVHV